MLVVAVPCAILAACAYGAATAVEHSAAQADGRPHGKVTYRYRRIYDSRTRAFLRQEPDTEIRTATAEDGTVSEYSHAGVLTEIFEKVTSGTPLIKIEEQLNERGM